MTEKKLRDLSFFQQVGFEKYYLEGAKKFIRFREADCQIRKRAVLAFTVHGMWMASFVKGKQSNSMVA